MAGSEEASASHGAVHAGAASGASQAGSAPALKGVYRALQVLEHLAVQPGRASDVAAALGVSWATLHRTLSELEQGGFLERDADTNRYTIGPRMWFVGTAYLTNHPVMELAQPHLEQAAACDDVTVQLVERSGRLAVTLYSHHTAGEIITKSTYGYHFPLHCGSKGQVLLAYAPSGFIDQYLSGELERLTPETLTDPAVLRERLAAIRRNGYCETEGDVQPFTGSLSAPVFDRAGHVPCAVSFIVRRSTLREEARREAMLETLLRTCHAISIGLGWRLSSQERD